ncbi:MAG: phytoene desaturase family protein [Chloroflexota bacterium]
MERITVEHGQVRGIGTDKGGFQAPVVVSNAGIQPTVLKLVGEEHFDTSYVNYVKDLVPSLGIMGVRYFLDKPVIGKPMYMTVSDDNYVTAERAARVKAGQLPDNVPLLVVVPSRFDPDLAPEGKQCVLVGILCAPGTEAENRRLLWDKVDQTMATIWLEFPQHIEHRETYDTGTVYSMTRDHVLPGQGGECIGLGQLAGQCGRSKPSPRAAAIRGLFYVGCDAGGYGCGTHQGVDSGFNVAQMVLNYHKAHRQLM